MTTAEILIARASGPRITRQLTGKIANGHDYGPAPIEALVNRMERDGRVLQVRLDLGLKGRPIDPSGHAI